MPTIEKRVEDLEFVIAHLTENLYSRFVAVNRKLAEVQETLAVHPARFSEIDDELSGIRGQIDGLAKLMEERLQSSRKPEHGCPRGRPACEPSHHRSRT